MRIAITPGEPAGIGPDLCVQLAQQAHAVELLVVADAGLLSERARQLGLPLQLIPFDATQPAQPQAAGTLTIDELALSVHAVPGQLNPANAEYVLATLRRATALCRDGYADAMVTGPVHKGVINDAGFPFTGHTEYLAAECGGVLPVMMLAAPGLRVALATTHLPLSQVSAAITREGLTAVLKILDQDLRTRFGIEHPRILVCGLNPHAGESGHLGMEEIEVITPTLDNLRTQGMNVVGPLSADTLFTPRHLHEADAVLAMYHDQGLPVLKYMGFGQAVNITLGLPMIRTSVDHGTALELAGSGRAEASSLQAALAAAVAMAGAKPGVAVRRFSQGVGA